MAPTRYNERAVIEGALHAQLLPRLAERLMSDRRQRLSWSGSWGNGTSLPNKEEPSIRALSRSTLTGERTRRSNDMKSGQAPLLAQEDVAHMVETILYEPFEAACALLDGHLAKGQSTADLILLLMSPAAETFGLRWQDDDLSFSEVTVAMAVLHSLLHRYASGLANETTPSVDGARLMLAPYPGENHVFGVSIVQEFFRADGWDVTIAMAESGAALARKVREAHFDVIGLSLAHESQLAALRQLIVSIRASSLNKQVRLLVGGPLVRSAPDSVQSLPVEGIALDARAGLALARELLISDDETEV
ncbi:MAG: cobalamin-dependent protein [Pseudomonadota bacterium]